MIVYVVTAGCYSDYHISAVFSSEEKAEKYIADGKGELGSDAGIEEWEVDEQMGSITHSQWSAYIHVKDGKIETPLTVRKEYEPPIVTSTLVDENGPDPYFFVRSPESQEHAVKVAVELRQAYLRDKAWIQPVASNCPLDEHYHEPNKFCQGCADLTGWKIPN